MTETKSTSADKINNSQFPTSIDGASASAGSGSLCTPCLQTLSKLVKNWKNIVAGVCQIPDIKMNKNPFGCQTKLESTFQKTCMYPYFLCKQK